MPGESQRKPLDAIDRRILRELQADGRLSFVELGPRVGLTTSPCVERVRRLEREGVIRGYSARLDPKRLDAGLLVFVEISLTYGAADVFDAFRRAILRIPQVMECYLVSGEFDYLIKARIKDMPAYRDLLGQILHLLPGIRSSRTLVVMEEVKDSTAIPVPDG